MLSNDSSWDDSPMTNDRDKRPILMGMRLQDLRVIHLPKGSGAEGVLPVPLEGLSGAFHLDSCQRRLWVLPDPQAALPLAGFFETFSGEAAYDFLLRVACGLESQVIGETDIFGQVKEAWSAFLEAGSPQSELLDPWMQKLFGDTKEIRSRHLQSAGGATYGSLVRRLLPERLSGPVLLIGAGQLARSISPYLAEFGIHALNRSAGRLEGLLQELREKHPGSDARALAPAEEAQAWRRAGAVVLCVPMDLEGDSARRGYAAALGGDTPVLHLGGFAAESGPWASIPGVRFLDELFSLEKSQGDLRRAQARRAAQACSERAKLRGLGGSVSTPHGWEDLAVFAIFG